MNGRIRSDNTLARLKDRLKKKCLRRIKDARTESIAALRFDGVQGEQKQTNEAGLPGTVFPCARKNARTSLAEDIISGSAPLEGGNVDSAHTFKKRAKSIIQEELALAKSEYHEHIQRQRRLNKPQSLTDNDDDDDSDFHSNNVDDTDDEWAFDESSLAEALLSVEEALEFELDCLDDALLLEAESVEAQDADALASQIESLLLDEQHPPSCAASASRPWSRGSVDSLSAASSSSATTGSLRNSGGALDWGDCSAENGGGGVLCPVCKKHWLVERDRGAICLCGVRLNWGDDCLNLSYLKFELSETFTEHRHHHQCYHHAVVSSSPLPEHHRLCLDDTGSAQVSAGGCSGGGLYAGVSGCHGMGNGQNSSAGASVVLLIDKDQSSPVGSLGGGVSVLGRPCRQDEGGSSTSPRQDLVFEVKGNFFGISALWASCRECSFSRIVV